MIYGARVVNYGLCKGCYQAKICWCNRICGAVHQDRTSLIEWARSEESDWVTYEEESTKGCPERLFN